MLVHDPLLPCYRRDSSEFVGAVRASAILLVALEQMPGGRFQLTGKVATGDGVFITGIIPNYAEALMALEETRLFLGGEGGLPLVMAPPALDDAEDDED